MVNAIVGSLNNCFSYFVYSSNTFRNHFYSILPPVATTALHQYSPFCTPLPQYNQFWFPAAFRLPAQTRWRRLRSQKCRYPAKPYLCLIWLLSTDLFLSILY